MAPWKALLLFGLIMSASLVVRGAEEEASEEASDEEDYADVERAQLVVRQSIAEEFGVVGRNLTVTIEVFNAGSS